MLSLGLRCLSAASSTGLLTPCNQNDKQIKTLMLKVIFTLRYATLFL